MKKITSFLFITLLLISSVPSIGVAASLNKLSAKEVSKQWEVVVGKPDNEDPKANISDKPDLYNVYSLDIKNIGDDNIELVRVEAYRNEPNTSFEYELFTVENDAPKKNLYPSFHHTNFPLYAKATELKIVVTWTKKHDQHRKLREQFVFKQY
ncbi:hypothetical protein V7147_03215 [Bacillus sp. JJ1521]|uniref:hypothetical protein n=1 Tax=Bacillus sp. JJ1521 TaxID=3122957 RepID=UPI003000D3F4